MPRPDALFHGEDVSIDSLDDAEKALHELSWLNSELERIDAQCNQKLAAIRQDYEARKMIAIGRTSFSLSDRIADLTARVEDWVRDNIARLLPKGKKTRKCVHGELGLRQAPLVVEIDCDAQEQKFSPSSVLAWIEESELTPSQKRALTETTTTLHLKGAKDALVAHKITAQQLKDVGLTVRPAADEPVVKAAKLIID